MASRRMIAIFSAALLCMTFSTLSGAQTPKKGGILRVATEGEPPSLDPHMTTATIVMEEGIQWLEAPFTQGEKYEVLPDLAESFNSSDNLKVWNITFRKGVLFHNGKEMTSEDIVASLNRWGKRMVYGKSFFNDVESLQATDRYSVRLTLKKGSSVVPSYLTQRARCFIYPKEVIDAAGEGTVKAYIGTGPFQLVEHRPDRYIKLKRFDKYVARKEPPNGYGGKKTVYVDEVHFIPVPEPVQRVNLLQGGEVEFSTSLVTDGYKRLKADPTLSPVIGRSQWVIGVFNKKKGLFTNLKLRQAVQAALDMDPIMMNAMGSKEFYRLDPSLIYKDTVWNTDAGKPYYNQANPEKAKKLMKEAGYRGETIRWLTTKHYPYHFNSAVVAVQQLQDLGFKVDLQVIDWATLIKSRNNPDEWEMYTTHIGIMADPSQSAIISCDWAGWTCYDELDALRQQLITQSKFEDRYETWKKMEAFYYKNAVNIKFGDYFTLLAKKNNVKGYINMQMPFFWNVWLDK